MRIAVEDLDADDVFLQALALAGERLLTTNLKNRLMRPALANGALASSRSSWRRMSSALGAMRVSLAKRRAFGRRARAVLPAAVGLLTVRVSGN
jgi:hypothetical protein